MAGYVRMLRAFAAASVQQELAYRTNFVIAMMHSLLNAGTGLLGLVIVFEQVDSVRGWDYASALAVLGAYLTVSAVRDLVISPNLEALAGMDGEVWRGEFDFTLLRPVNTQFLVSTRRWHFFALFDLLVGLIVLVVAAARLEAAPGWSQVAGLVITLAMGAMVLYAIFLAFASLVFWNPGFLFTWLFNNVFQLARYPVGVYPGMLRLVLTWVVPVGVITSVPAEALSGSLSADKLLASALFTAGAVVGASVLFRAGLRRYASASS